MALYDKTYFVDKKYGGMDEFLASYEGIRLNQSHAQFLNSIFQYARRLVRPASGTVVLDVGCGTGQFAYQLARGGCRVFGVDSSLSALQCFGLASRNLDAGSVRRIHLVAMNAEQIGALHLGVNVVTMIDFVEHLSDSQLSAVFESARRMLTVGGRLVIHTLPTKNYRLVGSRIVSLISNGKMRRATSDEERQVGHINLQSRRSLGRILRDHYRGSRIRVWYHMSNAQTLITRVGNRALFRAFVSPSLWATVDIQDNRPDPLRAADAARIKE